MEAPAQGSTPVVLRGPATIDGMLISLTNDAPTHFDALIQVAMDGVDSTTAGETRPMAASDLALSLRRRRSWSVTLA